MYILGHSDVGHKATYSGGTWVANLGLSQLTSPYNNATARTVGTNLVLNVDLDASKKISCLGLINHNLSNSATVQWALFADAGRTISTYDSNPIRVGTYDASVSIKTLLHAFAEIDSAYLTVTIDDPSNTDGYLQLSGVFIGKRLVTGCNISYGLNMGVEDKFSTILYSDHGNELDNPAPSKRYAHFTLENRTYDEGDEFFRILMRNGITGLVAFQFDEQDFNEGLYTFAGRFERLSPLSFPAYNINAMNFAVKEVT